MPKVVPVTYEPTNPPIEFDGWHRWIDDELHRIQDALRANPVIMAVEGGGTIGIDTTPTTIRLGIGDTANIDVPSGSWDPILGEYSIALAGIYQVSCQAFIEAFGPGNKTYTATLELFVNGLSRSIQISGGADDVPLALNLNTTELLLNADVLYVELTTLHDQFTGVSDYVYTMNFLRVASS